VRKIKNLVNRVSEQTSALADRITNPPADALRNHLRSSLSSRHRGTTKLAALSEEARVSTGSLGPRTAAAIKIQTAWRGRAQRGTKNPSGYNEILGEPLRDARTGALILNEATGRPERPIVAFAKYDPRTGLATEFLRNPLEPWEDGPAGRCWEMVARAPSVSHEKYGSPTKKLIAGMCRFDPDEDDELFPEPLDGKMLDILCQLKHVVVPRRVQETRVVMEEMDCDAMQAFEKDGPMPLSIFNGATRDLKAFHQAGALHRDIKPNNILLKGGVAYLCDFDNAGIRGEIFDVPFVPFFVDSVTMGNSMKLNRYGQAVDDYAMLLSLLILSGHENTAYLAKDRENILFAERHQKTKKTKKKKSGAEAYGVGSEQGASRGKAGPATGSNVEDEAKKQEAEASIRGWAESHAKPEHVDDILLLLDSPTRFAKKHRDQLHIHDMLKFDGLHP